MSQLRLNPLTGRWVVIAVDRAVRPGDLISPHLPVEADPDRPCPFCPGNEEATPPALETYGKQGTAAASMRSSCSRPSTALAGPISTTPRRR